MRAARSFPVVESLIVAVAVAAIAVVTYQNGRREAQQINGYDTYSTYDAGSGGYRAWYELLDREGVRVARFERRPAFLDGSVDVYVMASDYYYVMASATTGGSTEIATDGDWDGVARWVKAGGHLVWLSDGVTAPSGINAPVLASKGPQTDDAVALTSSPLTAGVSSVSGTSRLRVPFSRSFRAAPVVADDVGGVVVSYRLGKGAVTVISDESLFANGRLAKADNARLAYDVATTGLTPKGVVAFDEWSHGYVAGDTWWAILPPSFQIGLVAIGIALLLIAIPAALRFGPTARLPDRSERTSAEYLSSMAMLYARGRALRTAIDELADSCLRDVAASAGLPETAPARAIASRVGDPDQDGGPGAAVMEIDRIRSYEYPHDADLLRVAQMCAALRKEFKRHGRIGIRSRTTAARRSA
jgi:hypothetical protein